MIETIEFQSSSHHIWLQRNLFEIPSGYPFPVQALMIEFIIEGYYLSSESLNQITFEGDDRYR